MSQIFILLVIFDADSDPVKSGIVTPLVTKDLLLQKKSGIPETWLLQDTQPLNIKITPKNDTLS